MSEPGEPASTPDPTPPSRPGPASAYPTYEAFVASAVAWNEIAKKSQPGSAKPSLRPFP